MTGRLSVIVGGQYGSEAKGAVTAALVRHSRRHQELPMVVRVAGPNAGHTAYDDQGRAWALRQVPAGMVADTKAVGVIADGSEIDLAVLADEVDRLDAAGLAVSQRLYLSQDATLLTDSHRRQEQAAGLTKLIGSTGKGIGAARADRAMRTAATRRLVIGQGYTMAEYLARNYRMDATDTQRLTRTVANLQWINGHHTAAQFINRALASNDYHVMVEGTQGYGLGLHQPAYPQVTSSDCRAIDFLAMAGVNPWQSLGPLDIWVVVRAYPIRVAGDSGPMYNETTWKRLGLEPELTTVTKKVRRVAEWDQQLFERAVRANAEFDSPHLRVAYTMADQQFPAMAGLHGNLSEVTLSVQQREAVQAVWERTRGTVSYIGTGPNTNLWVGTKDDTRG